MWETEPFTASMVRMRCQKGIDADLLLEQQSRWLSEVGWCKKEKNKKKEVYEQKNVKWLEHKA